VTSALDGGEWSASRPGRFTPRERALGTHWIGGWVGPRAVLDAVVKRKIPSPCRESNPRTPIVQPVAQRYTDWAITALLLSPVSIIIIIISSSSLSLLWTFNPSTDFVCVKFVEHNLKLLHRFHICHSWFINNISYTICRNVYNTRISWYEMPYNKIIVLYVLIFKLLKRPEEETIRTQWHHTFRNSPNSICSQCRCECNFNFSDPRQGPAACSWNTAMNFRVP
jgi:hypothetical protein